MLTGFATVGILYEASTRLLQLARSSLYERSRQGATPSRPPKGYLPGSAVTRSSIDTASCRIRILSKIAQKGKECRRLADEETHVGQKLDYTHGSPLGLCRAND